MGVPGHVYVLLEPMSPGMVKIGLTRRSTERRVSKLYGTGRAVPLVALWDEYVSDPDYVESALHNHFAESRVNSRREFFYVTPKVAIAALIKEAGPYRVEPFRAQGRVEILPELQETYGAIFRKDLTSVEVLVTQESVLLVTTSGTPADVAVLRSNLDFIYDDDEPLFTPELSANENAQRFLDLGEFTLVMTTDLVSAADANRIYREQNPSPPQHEKSAASGSEPPPF